MRQFRSLLSCAAVCMLAILLHLTVVSCLQGAGGDRVPVGDEIVQTQAAIGQQCDGEERHNFKPPKHAFVDYSDFLLASGILPPHGAHVARLSSTDGSTSPPQIYLDIFMPPDQHA